MKLALKNITSNAKQFPNGLHGILIFGPDAGHVEEMAESIGKSHVADLNDPFQVEELNPNILRQDPACLTDAIMAFSMTGGNRLIRVRNCNDALAETFGDVAKFEVTEAKLIVEAGVLNARSKLRQTFEKSDKLGALACYGDEGRGLKAIIETTLEYNKTSLEPDALNYLLNNLGHDRLQTRSELKKLALYSGKGGKLTLKDVASIVGDGGALLFDDIAYSAADGDLQSLFLSLRRHESESQNPIGTLRSTIGHFQKLRTARAFVDTGKPIREAISSIRPPVFWSRLNQFELQVTLWTVKRIDGALRRLYEGESLCKSTGIPALTVSSQILLGICAQQSRISKKFTRN